MTRPSQSLIARARRARKRERMIDAAVRAIIPKRLLVSAEEHLENMPDTRGRIRAEFMRLEREGM